VPVPTCRALNRHRDAGSLVGTQSGEATRRSPMRGTRRASCQKETRQLVSCSVFGLRNDSGRFLHALD
jgi:hypothetical protein